MARMSGGSYGPYPGFDVGDLTRRRYVDLVRRKAGLWPGDAVLDVACGYGTLSHGLARAFTKCRVTAVESDEDEFARAVENAHAEGLAPPRLTLVEAEADALPFADESFLVTTCALGLSRAEDPVGVLEEMHRVTEFMGKVLVVDVDLTRFPRKPRGIARNVLDDDLVDAAREMGFGKVAVQKLALIPGGGVLRLLTGKRLDPEGDEDADEDDGGEEE